MKRHNIAVILSSIILISCFKTGLAFADTLWTQDGNNIYNTNSGNVGIGTITPDANLHINASIGNAGQYITTGDDTSYIFLLFSNNYSTAPNYAVIGERPDGSLALGGEGSIASPHMVITDSGNVGIGTVVPNAKLHIKDSSGIKITHNSTERLNIFTDSDRNYFESKKGNGVRFNTTGGAIFEIQNDGNVGIGTTSPQSKLAVNGTITAKEVKVLDTGWSDFVFEDTYNLPALDNIESYIKENKHLPGIPSAKEVEENGLAMSDMLAKHMQKIEELTLYLIELKKENNDLKQRVASLEKLTHKKH